MVSNMMQVQENWFDKFRADDAEKAYYEKQAAASGSSSVGQTKECQSAGSSLASEIARAREQIQKSLKTESAAPAADSSVISRLENLELENKTLRQVTSDLQAAVRKLEEKIKALETSDSAPSETPAPAAAAAAATEPAPKEAAKDDNEDDDDFDLFGDDDEDEEENERIKAERVKAYEAKKSNKPKVIAKSSLLLDVKPWDDETDMAELERCVRTIEMDGLLWGASKLVPVGYGIRKLQINAVVEDEKVSTDDLEEQITAFEDHVQSMDIAAFNKI